MTRADAILFTGGSNSLTLAAGYSIVGNVIGTGADTFQLGGGGAGSFNLGSIGTAQQYRGFSVFDVVGGTWIASGTFGQNNAWIVSGGTLNVTGDLSAATNLTVSGGTLTGTGNVGNTHINSGGTFTPGSGAPGASMTVNGSLAFQSGAQYVLLLNPATSSFASVTGSATLGGATVSAFYANGAYIDKKYTILTATGGVSGAFGSLVNTNLPSNFKTSLSYDGNNAYLNLALNFTPPPGPTPPNFPGGLSGNQNAVGNALIKYFNANGGIPIVYGMLTPSGLTQASGENTTGSQQSTFNAMSQFMGVMTDPFVAGRGDAVSAGGTPNAYAETGLADAAPAEGRTTIERDAYASMKAPIGPSFEQRWSVWAAGYGGSQTTDGNAVVGSNTATSRIYGTTVGADYRLSPFTVAGFALAGGGTSFGVTNYGTGRSDLFQAGGFIRHTIGAAYLSGALAYGWQDVTTNRTLAIAGIDQLQGRFNANAYSGRVEGGYRLIASWINGVGITPYAAGQFTTFDLPAYAERVISGGSAFALAYGARSATDTRSELGFRTDKSIAMQDAVLTLRGRAAWSHDYDPTRAIGAIFLALPGASFVVNGAAQAGDSALVTAAAEVKWLNGWSAAGTFEGEFSNVTRSYAGRGVVRYAW